jgi:hypothetical protein
MTYIPIAKSPDYPTSIVTGTPANPQFNVIDDTGISTKTFQYFASYSSAAVDLTSATTTTLFTTAASLGRFFPLEIYFVPNVDVSAAGPTIRVGYTNAGTPYTDWVSSATTGNSLVTNEFVQISLKADAAGTAPTGRYSAAASTSVILSVSSAATAPYSGYFIVSGIYVG